MGLELFFFLKYWNIIAKDVIKVVVQFFRSGWLLPNWNANIVVLIPKIPEAERIDQYRPIALANFKFKIITKVLANRLAFIASKIISPN